MKNLDRIKDLLIKDRSLLTTIIITLLVIFISFFIGVKISSVSQKIKLNKEIKFIKKLYQKKEDSINIRIENIEDTIVFYKNERDKLVDKINKSNKEVVKKTDKKLSNNKEDYDKEVKHNIEYSDNSDSIIELWKRYAENQE